METSSTSRSTTTHSIPSEVSESPLPHVDELTSRHTVAFWATCAALPAFGLVRTAFVGTGETPLPIVAVVFAMYTALLALLFYPTLYEARHNCDLVDRAVKFTIGSIIVAHIVAIGGAVITSSNAFLIAYLAVATLSLLILRNTPLCKTRTGTSDH